MGFWLIGTEHLMPRHHVAVIIPFRDRGIDPLREANLRCVRKHWRDSFGIDPMTIDDGRDGMEQFNRSAAYNRGLGALPDLYNSYVDAYVFAESDMLVAAQQVRDAIDMAMESPGMVVPFTEYSHLSPEGSEQVRNGWASPSDITPTWKMVQGKSIGAINVVSAKTMGLVGQWDERFEGNWYDDDAMKIAFDVLAGPTRWVTGPAYHLHHLPGHKGKHLSPEDRAATARNHFRHKQYLAATYLSPKMRDARIHALLGGAD